MSENWAVWWRIGKLIPKIIALIFALDCASRFLPIDALTFRAWEAMVRFHAPCAPFRANGFFDGHATYGDLSAMANLPEYRQYRREIFTTDSYGFRRNTRGASSDLRYRVILLGDSMAVGSGVNDGDTLSAQLEKRLGIGVYNGASPTNSLVEAGQIVELARRLGIREGTVIYQYLGRRDLPRVSDVAGAEWLKCAAPSARLATLYEEYTSTSPVKILAQKLFKQLQNDGVLPNDFHDKVIKSTVRNGVPMLFYAPDVHGYRRPRSLDAEGLKYLAGALGKEGLRLIVLLVPDKYTVYEPLLSDADQADRNEAIYLDRLETALNQAKVPVVNLTGFFREKARQALLEDAYLYWLDDTHWNARGIELAANELVRRRVID